LSFVGRLEVEQYTLPLAELLLEKMQIVQINEKDVIDTIMLLREHPLGASDAETINTTILIKTLSSDWGFWRTVTGNLKLVDGKLGEYSPLTDEDRRVVRGQISSLLQQIESAPKSIGWKVRARIGEKVKWYKDVEELSR
jgi:hypothetical protein